MLRGYAMKAVEPVLESAVQGIDVIEREDAIGMFIRGNGLVSGLQCGREFSITPVDVGAKGASLHHMAVIEPFEFVIRYATMSRHAHD